MPRVDQTLSSPIPLSGAATSRPSDDKRTDPNSPGDSGGSVTWVRIDLPVRPSKSPIEPESTLRAAMTDPSALIAVTGAVAGVGTTVVVTAMVPLAVSHRPTTALVPPDRNVVTVPPAGPTSALSTVGPSGGILKLPLKPPPTSPVQDPTSSPVVVFQAVTPSI